MVLTRPFPAWSSVVVATLWLALACGRTELGTCGANSCDEASAGGAPPTNPPIVLLLIDGSFSMFQSSVWVPTYEALMAASGPILAEIASTGAR